MTAALVAYGNAGNGNNGNNGNGNGNQDKPTGSDVKKTSTVVKQFVVDFSSETYKPLMEHEVNGLDYRYVYSDKARLSVVVQGIENGSASLLDDKGELHAYYHCDYLGTTDYLTSAVNSKVISWTSYSEWGEITHNAVLKCGQRELDLVKEYATHDFDAVLNMYYAKARFYDADNRRFTAVDPILDPSRYDLREYVTDPMQLVQTLYVKDNAVVFIDILGMVITITPEMQRAIDENRLFGVGSVMYAGKEYDIYVPTIKGTYIAPGVTSFDTAENATYELTDYDRIYYNYVDFSYFDWPAALADVNLSLADSPDLETDYNITRQGENLNLVAGVIDKIGSLAKYTRRFRLRVSLYENASENRRLAQIELRNDEVAQKMKAAAGGYYTVFACDYRGVETSRYYKFSFDAARAEDQYLSYLYKANGEMRAYMKKFAGDNIQLYKQSIFTGSKIIDSYGYRYTGSQLVNPGFDKKIEKILNQEFGMTMI